MKISTVLPMTDAEIRKAIRKKPSWCCGDPATCQGSTAPCSLNEIYEADLRVRRQHEALDQLPMTAMH